MNTDNLEDALERCFISPNVSDSNFEPANLVDVVNKTAGSLRDIANAITPRNAAPMTTPSGGQVGSLTEAVVYVADSLRQIADAIRDHADAVRDTAG